MAFDWFSLGLTIVDGLDTAYIMGLNEGMFANIWQSHCYIMLILFRFTEFQEGKEWINNELIFTKQKDVNFFEVTIRVLGALLTNYHFTEDKMFLEKAVRN